MQSSQSALLAGAFLAFTAVTHASTNVYNWTGVCADCTGLATGQLTMVDAIPTTFTYSSNWLVYTMQVLDFQTNNNFPTNPTIALTGTATGFFTSAFPAGPSSFTSSRADFGSDPADGVFYWNTSIAGVGSADFGTGSTFTAAPTGVPEPAAVLLCGGALTVLALARKLSAKRA